SFKTGSFEGKRHELDSPNLFGHFPITPALTLLEGSRKWAVVCKDNWIPPTALSPKRSQSLTSPEKKATASDRPSSLLRGNV
ncbi:hypothetical protein AVEN_237456-1, partial [Araneus ventricosus]